MKLHYETLLEKVVQARNMYAESDNHEAVLKAIQVRRGYESIAKESGIDMNDFSNKSCEKYLDLIFKE